MAVRIKICGITREQDAHAAVAAGAHGLGFVFHAGSPRFIEPEQARSIAANLPPFVTIVGVFVDGQIDGVREIARRVPLDLMQLHGQESPEYARELGLPFMRALRVGPDTDISQQARLFVQARAILMDTYVSGTPGGTGETFTWSQVPNDLDKPVVLAGGLNADNVADAIKQVRPYAVDVSSGVESRPGIKDHRKMGDFIDAVRGAA